MLYLINLSALDYSRDLCDTVLNKSNMLCVFFLLLYLFYSTDVQLNILSVPAHLHLSLSLSLGTRDHKYLFVMSHVHEFFTYLYTLISLL